MPRVDELTEFTSIIPSPASSHVTRSKGKFSGINTSHLMQFSDCSAVCGGLQEELAKMVGSTPQLDEPTLLQVNCPLWKRLVHIYLATYKPWILYFQSLCWPVLFAEYLATRFFVSVLLLLQKIDSFKIDLCRMEFSAHFQKIVLNNLMIFCTFSLFARFLQWSCTYQFIIQ